MPEQKRPRFFTAKEFAKILSMLAKKHPNMPVAYSTDDEGNGYDYCQFSPSVMKIPINSESEKKTKVICIN